LNRPDTKPEIIPPIHTPTISITTQSLRGCSTPDR
jgi:hypothetical protein